MPISITKTKGEISEPPNSQPQSASLESHTELLANHEKRIRQLEKKAKLGEEKLTKLIQEWNKQQEIMKTELRRARNSGR